MNDQNDQVGRVEFEFVEPSLVRVRYFGKLEGPELAELFDWMETTVGHLPYCLVEADMSGVVSAAPEARRLSADRLGRLPKSAVAVVGGNFAQRIIAKLVMTALHTLSRGHTKTGFFADRETAQVWLDAYAKEQES